MPKIFDVLAAICTMLALIFGMALDSPSNLPIKICLVCSVYLAFYTYFKCKTDTDYVEDFEDWDGEDYE